MSDTELIRTVEEGLAAVAGVIGSPAFSDYVRKGLEAGNELRYQLTIKDSNQGFVVALGAEKKLPIRSIKTLIRLQ